MKESINKQYPKQKQNSDKNNYFFILFISGLALSFAFLILKDIHLPSSLVLGLGILGIFILFLLSLKNLEFVFYIMLAYLPFNKELSGDFGGFLTGFNLTNIFIFILLFGLMVSSAFRKRKPYQRTSLDIPVMIFCLLGIISLIKGTLQFGSGYAENFIIPLKRWLTPIFLFFLASNTIKSKQALKNSIVIIMITVFIIGLMAVKEYAFDVNPNSSFEGSRISSIAGNPNMLGAFFVQYMFLFIAFFLVNWHKFSYWGMILPALACFRGIQVTFSRGAYIAFAFAGLAITFFKSKTLFILAVLILVFAIVNPVLLPAGIRERMASTFKNEQIISTDTADILDKSAKNRIVIWKGGINMIKDYPFGTGYGAFPYLIPQYTPIQKYMDAHNTYIIMAAEMGVHTLVIFLIILFLAFKNAFWLYRRVKDKFIKSFALGYLGCIFGLLMANMFGSRMDSEEVTFYFWILTALVMVAVRMRRREEIA